MCACMPAYKNVNLWHACGDLKLTLGLFIGWSPLYLTRQDLSLSLSRGFPVSAFVVLELQVASISVRL